MSAPRSAHGLTDGLYAIVMDDPPLVAGFVVENGAVRRELCAPWLWAKGDLARWVRSRFCRRVSD